jgi:hypothetical protein
MKLLLAACTALLLTAISRAQAPITMRESLGPDATYSIQTHVDVTGRLNLPAEPGKKAPDPMTISGTSAIDYDERLLTPMREPARPRSLRNYRQAEFRRTVGKQEQQTNLRHAVRRMVVLRVGTREFPFSPDGPITFGEMDLVRTDVFAPALGGLLPEREVRVGDRWKSANSAIEELTDMEKITSNTIECKLDAINGRQAKVTYAGKVKGVNEDGPTEQEIKGEYTFDLDANCISILTLTGVHELLDPNGNSTGRIEGKFTMQRRPIAMPLELSNTAMRGLALEPNADNTLLLYEGQVTGARFLYPRRWRVSNEDGRHITIEEQRGSGMLITIEPPARVPTVADYLKETQEYIVGQKGKILKTEPASRLRPAPREIEAFGLNIELNQQPARMEYYIVRFPSPTPVAKGDKNEGLGGATVAARLTPADAAVLRPEVEQIVKSIELGPLAPIGVRPVPNK